MGPSSPWETSQLRSGRGMTGERCFSSPVCPGSIMTQGKESRVGSTPRKVCMVHIGSLAQAPCAPRARVCDPGGPLEPHGQCYVGGHCPVAAPSAGMRWTKARERAAGGKSSQTPPWPPCSAQLCLLLQLGPPCRGAGLGRWPREEALGSACLWGSEQTWWVHKPWLRMGWDPQAWVGRPPGTAPASCYLSPC